MTYIEIKIKSKNGTIQTRKINDTNKKNYKKKNGYYTKIIKKKKHTTKEKKPIKPKELITIKIRSKTGTIQRRNIRKENFKFYRRVQKRKDTYQRVTKQQERKIKSKIKREKRQEKAIYKKAKRCSFNYETQNYIGYSFSKHVGIPLTIELDSEELREYLSIIDSTIDELNNKIKCRQRLYYVRISYSIVVEGGGVQHSANSTNISFSIDAVKRNTKDIFGILIGLTHSYTHVYIQDITLVNYEFRSSV